MLKMLSLLLLGGLCGSKAGVGGKEGGSSGGQRAENWKGWHWEGEVC